MIQAQRNEDVLSGTSQWTRCHWMIVTAAVGMGVLLVGASLVQATEEQVPAPGEAASQVIDDVLPGIDLWQTPPGISFQDFSGSPIPADFFGPGSDPFDGTIELEGSPLDLSALVFTDTIVRRIDVVVLAACPSEGITIIEIFALKLINSAPITVTFNGGMNPELWDVEVCLSDLPQPQGTMTIRHECLDGGTYDSTLPVLPKLIFTRTSDQLEQVFDFGIEALPPINLASPCSAPWVHIPDPGFGITEVTAGSMPQLDVNCDGVFEAAIPDGTSNFVPGIFPIPCICNNMTSTAQKKRITLEEAQLAAHGILPAEEIELNKDQDGDGHDDIYDNCIGDFNPDQADSDCDGIGDVCEGGGPPGGPAIPAVSDWGFALMTLFVLTAGTLVYYRRRLSPGAG